MIQIQIHANIYDALSLNILHSLEYHHLITCWLYHFIRQIYSDIASLYVFFQLFALTNKTNISY